MIEGFIIMVVTAILIRFVYEVITYEPKPPTTLTTLPNPENKDWEGYEPTDWVTIDTHKGHWYDGIHEMD